MQVKVVKLFVTHFTFTTIPNKTPALLFGIVVMLASPLPPAIRSSSGMQQSKLCNGDTLILTAAINRASDNQQSLNWPGKD